MSEGSEGTATVTGGPPRFFALLSHGGALLAGTCGRGIARSVDGGRTWAGAAGPAVVHALTVGPPARGSAAVLWAAGTGLHCSDDGGRSWHGAGLDGLTVYAVTTGPDGITVGTLDRGVLRSLDGGETWRGCDGPLGTSTVYRLLRLPHGELLAATAGRGVWRVGVDEHPLVTRPSGLDGLSVFALARIDGERILAGTREAGIYRSDDGGSTWTTSNSGLPDLVVHVLVSVDSGVVYAGTGRGVARSVDGGSSWERFGPELASHRIFSLMCVPTAQMFCGSYDGVWAWSVGGRWVPVDTGLSADDAYSVFVDRAGMAYAGTAAGALRSNDAGVTWTSAGVGIDGRHVYTVAPRASSGYLAGTDDGVLAGRDGRWEPAGLDHERVYCINEVAEGVVLAGTLGGRIWRGGADGGPWECTNDACDMVLDIVCSRSGDVLVATGTIVGGVKSGGILRSRDLGNTWEPADGESMAVYRIVESSAGLLFAGGQRCKLLRSRDGGVTWGTLDTTGTMDAKMFGLAIDRADRLYLGAGAQLLISDDGADTWRVAGEGLDGATVFDVADHPSGALLAATSWGLFRSLDRGCSWVPS